uniref:hypothetical protein n=1 Tax=Burkholderia anthina TaxID=179879 RepID=UPI00158D1F8F|nr:hypothetical protein [Burkholderia anthina]
MTPKIVALDCTHRMRGIARSKDRNEPLASGAVEEKVEGKRKDRLSPVFRNKLSA